MDSLTILIVVSKIILSISSVDKVNNLKECIFGFVNYFFRVPYFEYDIK